LGHAHDLGGFFLSQFPALDDVTNPGDELGFDQHFIGIGPA
jgi:hypothetical protein